MEAIKEFKGKYRWLSNFAPCTVLLDNIAYPTTEHAYQAAKTWNETEREKIRLAYTPGHAKKLGKSVTKRASWGDVKIEVMLDLLRQKYAQEPYKTLLLETGDALLEEGNTWGDKFWGICNGVGENWLGRLTMQVREEIRYEQRI